MLISRYTRADMACKGGSQVYMWLCLTRQTAMGTEEELCADMMDCHDRNEER